MFLNIFYYPGFQFGGKIISHIEMDIRGAIQHVSFF